ncbi:MAG: dihydrofolate reductase [Betaproteobacteria bacterium]|nr:dihydrofolate reductase [Betaproteobacteria bacterium]
MAVSSAPAQTPEKTAQPRISIIVAVARNGVIGRDNKLPWHLPADLKYFKALTLGHHLVMGRKTFESIGKALPGRTSVVVTRQPGYRAPGVIVAGSVEQALAACAADTEVFVIGGAELFAQILERANRLYFTEIQRDFVGDVLLPEFDRSQWREVSRERHRVDGPGGLEYHFVVYERARP